MAPNAFAQPPSNECEDWLLLRGAAMHPNQAESAQSTGEMGHNRQSGKSAYREASFEIHSSNT
jgi:hypothetical protein